MTPARLGPIHRDDELLDALGARQEVPALERDELTALLSGWTRHIDAGTAPVAALPGVAGQPHRAGRPPWRRRARIASAALAVTLTFSGGSVAAALVNTHLPVLQQLGTVGTYFLHGVFRPPAQQLPSPAPDGQGGLPAGPVGGSADATHAPRPVGDRPHGGERGPDRRRALAPGSSPAPSGSSTTTPGRADAGTATGQSGSGTTPLPPQPSRAGSPTDDPAGSGRSSQPPGSGGSAQLPTPGGQVSVPGAGVDVPDPLRVPTTPEDGPGDRPSLAPQPITPEPGDAPALPRRLALPDLPPLPEEAAPRAHVDVPRSALERAVSGESEAPGDPADEPAARPRHLPAAPTPLGGAPAEGPGTPAP